MKKKILVVEDEEEMVNILQEVLTKHDFDVKTAENGKVGLELVNSFTPDLIILDLKMPVMDGLSMLKALRKIEDKKLADLPVIVLTNYGDVERVTEAVKQKAEMYMLKASWDIEEIAKKVKEILEAK